MRARLITLAALAACLVFGLARSAAAADAQCLAWCEQSGDECGLSVRESKKECARHAATAGVDPLTRSRADTAYLCGWFRGNHCTQRYAGANCQRRLQSRLDLCLDAYAPDTASEYLACGEGERKALALCREELADCRAQCP